MNRASCSGGSSPFDAEVRLYFLTGPVHSGKTSLLDSLGREAERSSVRFQGYLSPAVWEEGKHIGYDLLTLPERLLFPFLRKGGLPNRPSAGPYYLDPEALDAALGLIRAGAAAPLLIVDEIGPLELEGKGVWPALEEVFARPPEKMLLTIRDSLIDPFRVRIPGGDSARVFGVGERFALSKIFGL